MIGKLRWRCVIKLWPMRCEGKLLLLLKRDMLPFSVCGLCLHRRRTQLWQDFEIMRGRHLTQWGEKRRKMKRTWVLDYVTEPRNQPNPGLLFLWNFSSTFFYLQSKASWVPGWLSLLSVWLLISAQVMISWFVGSSPVLGSVLTAQILSLLSLCPSCCSCMLSLSLSLSLK